jgi:GAF domain-containing protein
MKTNSAIISEIQNLANKPDEVFLEKTVQLLQRERAHFNWVGIYLLRENVLTLKSYVGKPSPHTNIPLNSGICGAAASTAKTIVVDDVRADSRYLACSIETRSEIVVPIIHAGQVLGEIDIDSDLLAAFTAEDKELLETIAKLLAPELVQEVIAK